MKIHYALIPLATMLVAGVGSLLTKNGMGWYKTLVLPLWTPPESLIGPVWTVLFVLAAVAAIILWNRKNLDRRVPQIMGIFVLNAVLNVLWTYLFFTAHLIGPAVFEAFLLTGSVVLLIALIWPITQTAALLLAPYAAWVTFATYLTYTIWRLNH